MADDEGVYSPVKKNGMTAMFHLTLQQPTVNVNGREYKFVHRKGVSLCWVKDEDVEAVNGVTTVCCGGRSRRLMLLANNRQVDLWEMQG